MAILLQFFSISAVAGSVFRPYDLNRTDVELSIDYFKTNANFLADGSKSNLLNGYSFQTLNMLTNARYVFAEDLAATLQIGVGTAESNDSLASRTNSSVSHILVGADYQIFLSEEFSVSGDLTYSYAIEKVSATTDSAINHSGADELKGIVTTTFDLGTFAPFLAGGINYRTQGLSSLFIYSFGTDVHFENLIVGGRADGFVSIKDDEKTEQPLQRDAITNRVNGGSKRYYGVNPTLLDTEFYLKYMMNQNVGFKFFGGYTLLGTNTAEGFHVGAALNWNFGGEGSSSTSKKTPARKVIVIQPDSKSFKEDTNDGVNQDYFKPVVPSKNNYIEQLEGSSQNLENATQPEPEEAPAQVKPVRPLNPTLEKDYKIKIKKKKKKSS